ncbi:MULTISPECIES: hypothetical protein [Gordonia]|uniref:Uncharacterized protein n=2 Tax=Gordonia TaxID=2053 RepID=L7LLI7_9ACTN|nr:MULTISPECIES: hypothetical protein [Gordonia]AUH67716.1 hypothetical protein CXX93_04375 [Gordonia sp. YC-JH1]KJR09413.1 hypothetical protein UG54_04555 [Gordonia sihwensis]MBY4568849.1 hypothetical protein [Gordonia sihwensis]WFN92605.1 hypothetical protein P5P27_17885 [Gordonia sihwensis]GAC61980.1 hypothetical protein GSI01S_27_00290 [Gordonia sihwensis NBRC 108236]
MTTPGPFDDDADRDRIPTQAELDAEDLAEIARRSKDSDLSGRYPARPVDPGPPPVALVRDARVVWAIAAVACLAWVVYGFANLSWLEGLMAERLQPGLQNVPGVDPGEKAASMASFWTPALLVGIPLFTALGYPLLVGTARAHSRNLRSIYLSVITVTVLFTVVGADLLFHYPEVSASLRVLAWVQCGVLVLSALITLRRPINEWLPKSMAMKPFRRASGG